MLKSISAEKLFKLPDMMLVSGNILHKDEVAKALKSSEAAMKQFSETLHNNL